MQLLLGQKTQIGVCLTVLVNVFLVTRDGNAEDRYRCNFRDNNFDNTVLSPISPGTVRLMRPDKYGLVMNIPSGQMPPSVGVCPSIVLKGDFELTASFTIPQLQFPSGGYGAGPTIYIATHSDLSMSAMIGRLQRPQKAKVYSTNIAHTVDGERQHSVQLFPTEDRSGKLKLVRSGAILNFLVAEDNQNVFRELRKAEFTTADIALVRLGVQQSDASTPVEVVWHDFSVQADELTGSTDKTKRYNPRYVKAPEPKRLSMWWSVAAGVVLIVLLTIVFAYRRNRSS